MIASHYDSYIWGYPTLKLNQTVYLSRPEMADVKCRTRDVWRTHGMCRLVPAAKVRVELPRLCTPWGTRKSRPGRSTMIFMIPKTKKPGGSMQGSTGISRTHMQLPSHLPFCLPDLACHVVNSPASLHDFSFSHILPVLGLAPVSRQVSSHLPPSSSAEMPQRTWGHVFVIKSSPICAPLLVSSGLYLVA